MNLLKSIKYSKGIVNTNDSLYPFNVPIIKSLDSIQFNSPVTLFIGENGTGKSTLLEAIAAAIGSITLGEMNIKKDPTLKEANLLGDQLKLSWNRKTKRGFFLRTEDYFSYIKNIERERKIYENDLVQIEREYKDKSRFAQMQAKSAASSSLNSINSIFGENANAFSHGESYSYIFQARLKPKGLYLIDEPEAALSPIRQLGFISMIKECVEEGSQFILATHSPILMAYPGAEILSFDKNPISEIDYEDIESVNLLRDFLNNPDIFLHRL